MNLERLLNQPCPKHGTKEVPATHLWKDCFIMKEFKNSDLFGMIRVRRAVQVQIFMVAAVQTLDFRIIRATRTTKVVITNRIITGISSSQVIRVTQSN